MRAIKTPFTAAPRPPEEADKPIPAASRRDLSWAGRIRRLGWLVVEGLHNLGGGARFSLAVLSHTGFAFRRYKLLVNAINQAGVNSLLIILVAGLFIGFVLGLQFHNILGRYGQAQIVGAGVALTMFRELGPVGAGLLFVGCACTSITAAIGLKKSSEQIAAMDIMAVDPMAYELAPRFWGAALALPLLTAYFNAVAIFGAYLISVVLIGIDQGIFWAEMQARVFFHDDFTGGVLKSAVFGLAVSMIAVHEGYACVPTAEGVARATTRSVIKGSLAILGLNFVLTAFLV